MLHFTCFAPHGRFLFTCVTPCIHLQFFKLLFQDDTSLSLFLKTLLSCQDFIAAFLHPDRQKKKKKRVVQLIYVMTIKDQLVLVLNPASCCTAPNRGKKRIFHASKGRNPNEIVPDDILQICRTELTNEYSWK